MKITGLLTTLIILLGINAFAQQGANFTHYMHNSLAVNPAYAGTRNALTATILHRNQWVGFEGSPKTYTFTIHSPIIRENIGLGLSMVNDVIGPITTTSVHADFSYHLRVSENAKLAMGLKAGLNHLRAGLSELSLDDQRPDPAFLHDFEGRLLPDFGVGFYLFTENWHVGLSAPKLLNNDLISNTTTSSLLARDIAYFISAGYIINYPGEISIIPSTLIRAVRGARIVADISVMVVYDNRFELGALYRTGDALGALVGFNITDQMRLGYSYDWSVANQSWRYNGGTHEVMLRYDFIYRERGRRIISPRYF